ncbi:ATP-dependent zinc metalloprotease FtsH [Corynebacterium felinum]|uniref:ATP-dependent zinc metalloprotease FtsH n=1 Tax=Corynebacterium felinum TaxID=131318 RepID=A0ABU2B5G3_9CORY|nr:ATP-dependent zinc metalloprotease FtsH [Corynebacterium felinum]MDF5820108.1 ATP-dependent zinc metalloprotease FtsH [Corynebacterium felinum]MDR7353853.1 cell division protease FtsH [Corynebacterium felinum]WJY96028.1 ATP-dependent zinc metalloprotease FtsH [Corynebacterium felinum]
MKNKKIIQIGAIAAIVLISLYLITLFGSNTRGFLKVETSVAVTQLEENNVAEATIDDREQRLRLKLKNPIEHEGKKDIKEIMAQYPARSSADIFATVRESETTKFTTNVTQESFITQMLSYILPMVIVFGLIMFMFSRMQGGGMGMFGFGSSKAKELNKDMPTNTFADVAGADEAVDELHEIKDFLQDPARYEKLGAKIPRGVLLYGPPGTGKTLLARAVAGEAGVPFYSISGSDFVEMFVGVGASRVRDLFKQARENSPCIIFVDEIDAVGRQRGSGMGGGHDEREQTLNQLLVEMDGFGDREGVILMAATNRPDILDQALLRPGRFDRQIPVTNPDLKGREQILEVHAKGKPFAKDADLKALARRTAGMSGADLANVLNEAALLTARIGGNVITADALEEATDRVIGGPRRSSKVISEKEKKVTAYHEGGHTLAAWALKNIDRVYKVTILARGRTGGHAMTAQEDDKGMYNRDELYARLVFAMGGRAAEELVFGEPTTGASADIEMATKIAKSMLVEYGMSPSLGMVKYGAEQGDPFSGRAGQGSLEYSPETAALIDREMKYLLDKAHAEAYNILAEYRDYLDKLAEKLLEKETLRRPDLEALFDGITPRPVGEVFPGQEDRFPRQAGREPVKTPTELALERGEEPPKPFSLVEASKAARAKRQAELEAAKNAPVSPSVQGNPVDATVPGDAAKNPNQQRYGGTPPPAGWVVPGDKPVANPYALGQQPPASHGVVPPAAPAPGVPVHTQFPPHGAPQPPAERPFAQPQQPHAAQAEPRDADGAGASVDKGWAIPTTTQQVPTPPVEPEQPQDVHPGVSAYGSGDLVVPAEPEEEIGFRLPENERTENPWSDEPQPAVTEEPAVSHSGFGGTELKPVDAGNDPLRPSVPLPSDSETVSLGRHRAPKEEEQAQRQALWALVEQKRTSGQELKPEDTATFSRITDEEVEAAKKAVASEESFSAEFFRREWASRHADSADADDTPRGGAPGYLNPDRSVTDEGERS